MKRFLSCLMVALTLSFAAGAQNAPDTAELTRLLNEFLDGASRSDSAVHDRFWAEDLIYTGSAGRRIGKADIMRGQRSASAPRQGTPATVFSAEDIRIQQYGTTAVVAFRLVGTTKTDGKNETSSYLNSGTFLKRNGKWQVVNWQSTRMPRPEEDSKKEVTAIETAFHQALLAADIKKLESLMDEAFVWTHDAGNKVTRQELLDQIVSGRLKYSKLENQAATISVSGDTAVARGASLRQRASIPGGASGDANPFTAYYTITFVNKGNGWKAVAMHSSRP